jgi:hypothetical protein
MRFVVRTQCAIDDIPQLLQPRARKTEAADGPDAYRSTTQDIRDALRGPALHERWRNVTERQHRFCDTSPLAQELIGCKRRRVVDIRPYGFYLEVLGG